VNGIELVSTEEVRDTILHLENKASTKQVADELGVKYDVANFHIARMRKCGWLTRVREGRSWMYSVRDYARCREWA
jgi:predicted transcriptional regulator